MSASKMDRRSIIVAGGGAAGFFGAIHGAEGAPNARVEILERGPRVLEKVRISGGGRCNTTHACFDTRDFATRYPRGGKALLGPFQRFSARDAVEWFARRGVELKTEADGRMFPVTNSSQTIIDCLMRAASDAGVRVRTLCAVDGAAALPGGGFRLTLSDGGSVEADRLLLATGGCRSLALGALASSLGHTLVPPAPSLFAFHIETPWLRALSGVALERAEVSAPDAGLEETGPLLITHLGLSGPAVLRLSAWGARVFQDCAYRFPLRVNWLPDRSAENLAAEFQARRTDAGARTLIRTPLAPLSARLWEQLVLAAGIPAEARWAALTRAHGQALARQLQRTEFTVTGKSLNKDEFVTCGGVALGEVNLKTMESRLCPGLHFAGELLDIDGITGGFNFQAAWTTGFIAGSAMAAGLS